jgi:hypothetical protein
LHIDCFSGTFLYAYAATLAETQVNNKLIILLGNALRGAKGHAYAATIAYLIVNYRTGGPPVTCVKTQKRVIAVRPACLIFIQIFFLFF